MQYIMQYVGTNQRKVTTETSDLNLHQGIQIIMDSHIQIITTMKRMIMSSKYLWLAVSADEYELPLAVTDSPNELARIFGISKSTVKSQAKRNTDGSVSGRKFIKVERDNNE